jgi:hypothetical protein
VLLMMGGKHCLKHVELTRSNKLTCVVASCSLLSSYHDARIHEHQHSSLPLKWSLHLWFLLKFRDCSKMGKATTDYVFQIYFMLQDYFSALFVLYVIVFSHPIFVAALKQSAVSSVFLVRKIVYLTYGRHTTSAVAHLVDFDLVTSRTQL